MRKAMHGSLFAGLLVGLSAVAGGEEAAAPEALARANDRFGLKLLRGLHQPGKNACVSPASVAQALHMTALGAAGETQAELLRALGVEGLALGEGNRALLGKLLGSKDATLRIANSVWSSERSGALLPGFAEVVRRDFQAEARAVDFSDPATLGVINGWVGEATEGMIPALIDQIPPDAALYLINAVYFKGSWTKPFEAGLTHPAAFTLHDGGKQEVQLMSQTAHFPCVFGEDVSVVQLPYGEGGGASMWIALPKDVAGLPALIEGLTPKLLSEWSQKARKREVEVSLPRFRLSCKVNLNTALEALGIVRAFDFQEADFSPMAERGDELVMSRVLHETVVEVNEEGTEAAAATAVEMKAESLSEVKTLRCDRPFAFVIQEHATGSILFAGAVYKP